MHGLDRSFFQELADGVQFLPATLVWFWIAHFQFTERVEDHLGNDQPGVLLVIGGDDIPRSDLGARRRQAGFVGVLVILFQCLRSSRSARLNFQFLSGSSSHARGSAGVVPPWTNGGRISRSAVPLRCRCFSWSWGWSDNDVARSSSSSMSPRRQTLAGAGVPGGRGPPIPPRNRSG